MTLLEETRARFPLTLKHVGEAILAEFEAPGTAPRSFVEFVNARYARGTIPDRAVRDLARYEDALARLAMRPSLKRPDKPLPADDVPLLLSPDVTFLMFGADLPGMLAALREGKPATPRPRRGWLLLVPAGGGHVDITEVARDEGWLLEWFREPTPLSDALEMMEERAPFEQLWKQGLLVRA